MYVSRPMSHLIEWQVRWRVNVNVLFNVVDQKMLEIEE